MSDVVLRLEGVSKRFRRGPAHDTLSEWVGSLGRRLVGRGPRGVRHDEFWALDGVSFDASGGEAIGLIGPNGAGKSTALKLIAGILRAEKGTIHARGRLTALIEIGAGFHGDLTGRENIYMNASILGMRRAEIERKMDAIVHFSGIESFIDTPVKRYSTGMQARLGFSVAAHVEPDILIVDEVLSVGDVMFRQRCVDRMRELVDQGSLLLFVTHQLEQMQSFCSRAIVLDRGRLIFDGTPSSAVAKYIIALRHHEGFMRTSSGERYARITDLHIRDETGRERLVAGAGQRMDVEVCYELDRRVPRLAVEVDVRRDIDTCLVNFSSIRDEKTFDARAGAGKTVLSLPSLPLAGGQYFWRAILRDADTGGVIADTDFRYSSVVEDGGLPTGIMCLPHTWADGVRTHDGDAAPEHPSALRHRSRRDVDSESAGDARIDVRSGRVQCHE